MPPLFLEFWMHMISIEERESPSSLCENSQNIKALVAPMTEWVREQGEVDEKTGRRTDSMRSA